MILSSQDTLLRICGPGAQQDLLRLQLVKPRDPFTYAEALVSQVLCTVNSNPPPLDRSFTLQQHSSQSEVSILHSFTCASATLQAYSQHACCTTNDENE